MQLHIVANTTFGAGMSGGDRILIECARRWAGHGHSITLFVWEEGGELYRRNHLDNVRYVIWSVARFRKLGFALLYLIRTLRGCIEALRISKTVNPNTVVYSASDFLPDSLPGFLMARRLNVPWIASLYLFAPNPFKGFRGNYRRGFRLPDLKTMLYYLSQRIPEWLIRHYAAMVFVTSEPDRQYFMNRGFSPNRVIAIQGGVDLKEAQRVPKPEIVKYDAAFVGRFHPQKGVIELIDIWDRVRQVKPNARLAIIGEGSLEPQMRQEIEHFNLQNNIDLYGFTDGEAKYRILKSSRLFLHPAIYDSGGMAAIEGMACGLPAVGFDLPALKTYYPQGMLKAPIADLNAFAQLVLNLLDDSELYIYTSQDALDLAEQWDWDKRASDIIARIQGEFGTEVEKAA
ncbi:MAG: glycosyltransferase family 4 protein [Chloroflexi bacterium]|nr:glycosyltransferase family 4 protein [Chloroflexota bacterium]